MRQRLEGELADARRFVRRCRESDDERAADLHSIWIDLLLDEWQRCGQPVHTIVHRREEGIQSE
ncbi:MAG TPA: hypothetical protein VFG87_13030 [Amycolatopsis sp.]|nr:hypothetical protein [Amycolatopsis sp.]